MGPSLTCAFGYWRHKHLPTAQHRPGIELDTGHKKLNRTLTALKWLLRDKRSQEAVAGVRVSPKAVVLEGSGMGWGDIQDLTAQ